MPKIKLTGKTAHEIYNSVRGLVQRGDLRAGDLLPSVRELADTLGVNRNTVSAAYQKLSKSGIAITQGRNGTSISAPPSAGEQEGLSAETPLFDVADGNPNPSQLPSLQSFTTNYFENTHLYGGQTVSTQIMELGREWFAEQCPGDYELLLTGGAIDAVERLAAAHLAPGDIVAVENPCFLGTKEALRLAGMQLVGISIDDSGIRVDDLKSAIEKGARAVLITPRAHNPTGVSLTEKRASELQKLFESHPDVLVMVDDHFALLAQNSYCSPISQASSHWAVIRSVSKGLGPDLRLAFLACDQATAARLRARLARGMTWVSHILQSIVVSCLQSTEVRERMQVAKIDYQEKRARLVAELKNVGFEVPGESGLNVWITLDKEAKTVAYEMAKRGWLVRLGNAYNVGTDTQAIRVTITRLEGAQACKFAKDLSDAVRN